MTRGRVGAGAAAVTGDGGALFLSTNLSLNRRRRPRAWRLRRGRGRGRTGSGRGSGRGINLVAAAVAGDSGVAAGLLVGRDCYGAMIDVLERQGGGERGRAALRDMWTGVGRIGRRFRIDNRSIAGCDCSTESFLKHSAV